MAYPKHEWGSKLSLSYAKKPESQFWQIAHGAKGRVACLQLGSWLNKKSYVLLNFKSLYLVIQESSHLFFFHSHSHSSYDSSLLLFYFCLPDHSFSLCSLLLASKDIFWLLGYNPSCSEDKVLLTDLSHEPPYLSLACVWAGNVRRRSLLVLQVGSLEHSLNS